MLLLTGAQTSKTSLIKLKYKAFLTSKRRRHTVEMYASAIITFTHLYTYDLDIWPLTSDLENLYSNAHSHDKYLRQVSTKSLH